MLTNIVNIIRKFIFKNIILRRSHFLNNPYTNRDSFITPTTYWLVPLESCVEFADNFPASACTFSKVAVSFASPFSSA